MNDIVYADNAATTMMDRNVIDTFHSILSIEYANPSQQYPFSKKSRQIIEQSRKTIADIINANPDEIFFTSGGTESNNWAIRETINNDKNRNITIVSSFEHHSILNNNEKITNSGGNVIYLYPRNDGHISPSDLEKNVDNHTRLVSIMLVNNELGTIQPIKKLCKIAHKHGALFHTDAVQALGHISVDVEELGVDLLSASAHKFNGPKGIGFLYIRKGTNINPLIVGGSQENNYRAGTENTAAIAAMACALKNNIQSITEIQSHLMNLESIFYQELDDNGINYHTNSLEPKVPGLINISFDKIEGEPLQIQLGLKRIFISTGSACDSKSTQISHVLKSINLENNYAKNAVRISFGKYNTEKDVKTIVSTIKKIIENCD